MIDRQVSTNSIWADGRFPRVSLRASARRIWNASPLRLIGPAGQADLSLRPSAIIHNVSTRVAEMFERAPDIHPAPVPYAVVCVYRKRNAANVAALGLPRDATYLWALDEIASELADMTCGVGPGNRFELLNRALAERTSNAHWLVVVDDDVRMSCGTLASAVSIAAVADLDLCGVSHSRWSFLSWSCTLHNPKSIARVMHYVEQGPCVILSPVAQKALVPFPEDMGMGWGIEYLWSHHDELRLGILDAVSLRHLQPVNGLSYDVGAELDQASNLQKATPFASLKQMQQTVETWKIGQPVAPWL